MIPTSFEESNCALSRPADMTDDQCAPLSVCKTIDANGFPVVISCWKMTALELVEFHRTGRVWLIIAGDTMPPARLSCNKP